MRKPAIAIGGALVVLGCAFGGPLLARQTGGLKADLLRDWSAQKARMVAVAEAMPADKYEFKATPAQRTFGEQLHHLGQANVNLFKRLDPEGKVPAPDVPSAHDRETVTSFLAASYDYGAKVLESLSDDALAAPTGPNGATPARTVWAAMSNAANHYGQCVVYLRLNGIVPPASRR
ncbi:MAG TPA: DinB family protein [Vicinamibacterales bacterium]